MEIYANQIPALLAPLAQQAHLATERAHIFAGYARHGSGYVCEVTETEVVKYTEGSNSTTHFPIASIDLIVITDRNGKELREYDVIRDEPAGYCGVRPSRNGAKWEAHIGHDYRSIYLGTFPTKEAAIAARKAAEDALNYHENHGARPALATALTALRGAQ